MLFKTKKQKEIERLTKVGVEEFGCSENYARISSECCVNKTKMNISCTTQFNN